MNVLEMKCLRSLVEVSRTDRVKNEKKKKKERKNVYSNKKYLILQCLHT